MNTKLMSAEEVADYLQVPKSTIYHWRNKGKGPKAYRVGKYIRFYLEDVDSWLKANADER